MLPQIVQPMLAWREAFPGQRGVPGSASTLGFRTSPRAVTLWVDADHDDASDNNDGTDPNAPLATIGQAVDQLENTFPYPGSQIRVAPGSYSESVVTPDYATGPNYCSIVGLGPSPFGVQWGSGDEDSPCLDLRALGWRIENIRFYGPANVPAVYLRSTVPNANDIAIRTVIQQCYFDGLSEGLAGIDFYGAPYDVWILDSFFAFFHQDDDSGAAIISSNSDYANAYRVWIEGCRFYESDNHIAMNPRGFNVSVIKNNVFNPFGASYDATLVLDLRGGSQGENMVVGNYFGGDYSNTGGYYANAGNPGMWVGNFAEDVAEAEVGDNGITIAPPAA